MGIGKATFSSAGQLSQHLIPGGYSRIDSVKGAKGFASANNGVIMGQCTGGEPVTLLQFNTIAAMQSALKGGPLMEAMRLAFNPGDDLVPQRLFAMRVNTALQSSLTLDGPAANDMVKLESRGYGIANNQIKVTVATGTNYGKKITIAYKTNPDEVFDDMRRQSFTIEYTVGACTMTIVNHSGAQTLTSSVGGLSIDLNDYPKIGDLAAYINNQTGFTCTPIAGQEEKSSLELDGVVTLDIYTTAKTVESTMQVVVDILNAGSVMVEASAVNAAVSRAIPTNLTLTYMTGGSEGSYTATEWTAALLALEAENIQFVSTPDSSASVHAAIKTHCTSMCAVTGRKERQFVTGSPTKTGTKATDIDSAKSAAQTLNSKFGLYAFNGGTQYNVDGIVQSYSGSYAACMLMGMKCALAINAPLTFKKLNFIELEYALSDPEMEDLIENGVAPVNYSTGGLPQMVRQVNTYQTDDLKWNEFSMATEMLFASRDLRTYLEELFVGGAGNALTGGVLRGAVENRLASYVELGIFIKDANGIAWWNVQIAMNGDVVLVDYDAYITAPVNFIFITNHMHVMASTV